MSSNKEICCYRCSQLNGENSRHIKCASFELICEKSIIIESNQNMMEKIDHNSQVKIYNDLTSIKVKLLVR